ncbi:MAG: hypothetical protein HYY43_00550 [Deltaproteobacteria bacterium]|nr:hypothetical protein [Deltaproteobacteria bacterium]MBI2341975.1 hypothetical protein [Deltaproteobacteria bacterium]MBI2974077.1 hypothetical protein [Deltaproteobacteria bacterium]
MSKTIFDPNAKTLTIGDDALKPLPEKTEASPNPSTYASFGASKWKAIAMPTPNAADSIGSMIASVGDSMKPAIDNGITGGLNPFGLQPVSQFGLRIQKTEKKEYLKHFKEVDLPPSFVEAAALLPKPAKDKDAVEESTLELKNSITETRSFYQSYLDYYTERRNNAEKALTGGKLSPHDADVVRQFVSKIDEAINFTNVQLKEMEIFETEKGLAVK